MRTEGRAVMGVDAEPRERELRHVGAADGNEAGRPQSRYRGRIRSRGGGIAECDRARGGHLARDIE